MLALKGIVKNYVTGDTVVGALKGVDIEFRKNEFVSILGPSGCGKTTLLNIVGGLDRYTEGDLLINGRSTKEFDDGDWDSYRNHSIGFVFQNYNLIPHQTVLSNVELALTLSGVSKSERKKRAKAALEKVGLGDQLNKKPNQMSGGQMQRVAIARALVNDPEILLADEPTGALDSETSVQIMDILKEIANDRLVIMVTHNPDLAAEYSTRIIRLLDGKVTDDSNPYKSEEGVVAAKISKKEKKKLKKKTKTSMSFITALSLSINNLLTKKTRTLLVSFAGSIGIIGIALILSVSTGVQNYINYVQRDTLSSYPITIQGETLDMTALMMQFMGTQADKEENKVHDGSKIYLNSVLYDMMNSLSNAQMNKNNLKAFKEFIENSEEFKKLTTSIQYVYDYDMNIFVKDVEGNVVESDVMALMESMMSSMGMSSSYMSGMSGGMQVWEELLEGDDGELISSVVKEQYNVVAGEWPDSYDEVVLIVNKNNELSDLVLYSLGLITKDDILDIYAAMSKQEQIEADYGPWDVEDLVSDEAAFKLILSSDLYQKQPDGTYSDLSATEAGLTILYNSDKVGIPLKISGIITPNEDATANMLTGSMAYTTALTDKVMELTLESELIKAQLADTLTDMITGLPFKPADYIEKELTAAEKAEKVLAYFDTLSTEKKAELYRQILLVPTQQYVAQAVNQAMTMMTPQQIDEMLVNAIMQQYPTITKDQAQQYLAALDEEQRQQTAYMVVAAMTTQTYSMQMQGRLQMLDDAGVIGLFATIGYGEADHAIMYDEYVPNEYSESTYEDNLKLLGYVTEDNPSAINIFVDTFEDKDAIADLIAQYNKSVENEDDQIEYTDYIALLMSSITTIINAISYVLVAFVAISLVVSSIMIGIITYISVLERTKEIGVLRSIGASKKDISRVFNAETLIVGFAAGAIGIIFTLLINIPINIILFELTEIANLKAVLPVGAAFILVLISMALTLIAGVIPARIAAKKDPVVALRTE